MWLYLSAETLRLCWYQFTLVLFRYV